MFNIWYFQMIILMINYVVNKDGSAIKRLQLKRLQLKVATQKNLTLMLAIAANAASLQLLQLLATSAIIGNFCNYWQLLQLLATSAIVGNFCNYWQLLQLLATSAIVGNFCNYWQLLQLLAIFAIIGNFCNYWQLLLL
jgi:hypothetical protein